MTKHKAFKACEPGYPLPGRALRNNVPRGGMWTSSICLPSAWVVEAFDVVEDVGTGFISGAIHLSGGTFGFSDEKQLFIADLAMASRTSGVPLARSQTLPARLIEHVMPLSVSRRWNCSRVHYDPWSE